MITNSSLVSENNAIRFYLNLKNSFMTIDIKNLIRAAQEECGNGRNRQRTELVITQLGLVISNLQAQKHQDQVSDWARLMCFRASLQIKIRQAGTAAQHLEPLVRNGGLLNRDPVAHTTYANALINAGQAGTAAQHLEPLVRNGGLLNRDPVAHTTYANALINAGQAGTAAQHLEPLVRNGGLLNSNPVAHTTYANALINAGQAGTAAQHLEPLVRNGGLLNSNPVAHTTYANALINAGQAGTAAQHLEPLVRNGGLLNSNPVAHTTYANALINAGQAGTAAQHLEPLVRNGGLLNRNPAGIYSLCKALYLDDKKNASLHYGMEYIRISQASNEKGYINGVGILLAIFDKDEPSITELKADLVSRYGQYSLDSAVNVASIWHQKSLPVLQLDLTSDAYYGQRGTLLAVITDGGYSPISRSDRLKAGLPSAGAGQPRPQS